jgi:hypothetical protein
MQSSRECGAARQTRDLRITPEVNSLMLFY